MLDLSEQESVRKDYVLSQVTYILDGPKYRNPAKGSTKNALRELMAFWDRGEMRIHELLSALRKLSSD